MIKTEFKFGEVFPLDNFYRYDQEKVSFNNVWGNENGGVSILLFKQGQELAEHLAPADVMVIVMDGEIDFTMNGIAHRIRKGEFLLMGSDVPHSVKAYADSRVMLIKIRDNVERL